MDDILDLKKVLFFFGHDLEAYDYVRGYGRCVFDSTLVFHDLCHLIHNEEYRKKLLIKEFDCDEDVASFIINFPLINVVPGSRKWNGTAGFNNKIGDIEDVTYVPSNIVKAAKYTLHRYLFDIEDINLLTFINQISKDLSIMETCSAKENALRLKDLHYSYREFFNIER